MVNKEGMPVPEEKSERRKLLDCLENVRHGKSHPDGGAGDHLHYHGHHGSEGKDHGKNAVSPNEHSHLHTHEGEGDPLAALDVGVNEIVITENEFSGFDAMDLIQPT